jgi:hypothetical protein
VKKKEKRKKKKENEKPIGVFEPMTAEELDRPVPTGLSRHLEKA